MKLHALSVVAPWGERIADGSKRVEVRRWRPSHVPIDNLLIVQNGRRLTEVDDVDSDGRAVAIVTVREVGQWTPQLAQAACSPWEPGWLAWVLTDVRAPSRSPLSPPAGCTRSRSRIIWYRLLSCDDFDGPARRFKHRDSARR